MSSHRLDNKSCYHHCNALLLLSVSNVMQQGHLGAWDFINLRPFMLVHSYESPIIIQRQDGNEIQLHDLKDTFSMFTMFSFGHTSRAQQLDRSEVEAEQPCWGSLGFN